MRASRITGGLCAVAVASPRGGLLWSVEWRVQSLGAATLPTGLTFSRASTEWPRADAGGALAYGTALATDVAPIARVGSVVGLQVDGAYANDLTAPRGSQMGAAPWTAGNVSPTLSAGAGPDGLANAAARFNVGSGGYPTAYTRYVTAPNLVYGTRYLIGAHCKPYGADRSAQVRWSYSSVHYAEGGDIQLDQWTRVEAEGVALTTGFFFTPVETGNYAAQGGIAASAHDLLADMAFRYAMPATMTAARGPLGWHDSTHAGPRASCSAADCVRGGRLDVAIDANLPYSWSLLRWDSRLWTLAGTGDTFVEVDQVARRLRVSVHGVEVKFPVEIASTTAQVVRFRVAAGNGRPTATIAISDDGGETFGPATSLGAVDVEQPPIWHVGGTVDFGSNGTANQFEGVHTRWAVYGSGSADDPYPTVYASTAGTGAGTLAAPASLADGLTAARALLAGGARWVRLALRAGTYYLSEALSLTTADEGLVLQAYPGEVVEFSGAIPITGWVLHSGSVYRADVNPAHLPIRHISVNGTRAKTAISSVTLTGLAGWDVSANPIVAPDATIDGYTNPQDVRLLGRETWKAFVLPVTGATGTAVTVNADAWSAAHFQTGYVLAHIVGWEGGVEQIAAAGDYAYDSAAGRVYYHPRPGDNMATADARLPRLTRLLNIVGTADTPIERVRILGIKFSDTNCETSQLTSGWNPLQASIQVTGTQFVSETWTKLPDAVLLSNAHNVVFGGCTFTRLGGDAVWLFEGSQDCGFYGCTWSDISGGALNVGWLTQENQRPSDARIKVSRNTVRSCTREDIGVNWWSSAVTQTGFVDNFSVIDCDASRTSYSGDCIGIGWGYAEDGGYNGHGFPYSAPPMSGDTVCAANAIRGCKYSRINRVCSDGGPMYTIGKQPGTVIVKCYTEDNASSAGCFAIYTDNGSRGIAVSDCVLRSGNLGIQPAAPKATYNTFTGCWIQGSPLASGVNYDATNAVTDCTWYTTWSTTAAAQAVIDAAGR